MSNTPEETLNLGEEQLTPDSLPHWRQGKEGFRAELADFLEAWFDDSPTLTLRTSGSTGAPKDICVRKEAMRASARLSCSLFGLTRRSSALLCLPLRYIAGQMMVVRALVSGLVLRLESPSSTPLQNLVGPVDFAPMVPMQVSRTLAQPGGRQQISLIRTLLLGGGFVPPTLEEELQSLPSRVFVSYGMTETLSHIALRRLNGEERSPDYHPLPGVHLAQAEDGALRLTVPHLGIHDMPTQDIITLREDGSFLLHGRKDAVINSGGIKIQAEDVEQALTAATGLHLVALPLPHPVLGQCLALLWEGPSSAEDALRKAGERLPRYHHPAHYIRLDALPRTESGKIARAACAKWLRTHPELTAPQD